MRQKNVFDNGFDKQTMFKSIKGKRFDRQCCVNINVPIVIEACIGYFGIGDICLLFKGYWDICCFFFLFWDMGYSGILGHGIFEIYFGERVKLILGYGIFWTVYFGIWDIANPLTKPRYSLLMHDKGALVLDMLCSSTLFQHNSIITFYH